MYMNGHGPMMGGHRGPMGGPRPRTGCVHGTGFHPVRVDRRPMGFFPIGGILVLPALLFGGWIAVAVIGGVLSLVGSLIGGVFEGLGTLAEGTLSDIGVPIGIVIGLTAFFYFRNRNAKREESAGTIDGMEVETEIRDPMANTDRTND